jgi:hypothetical protein
MVVGHISVGFHCVVIERGSCKDNEGQGYVELPLYILHDRKPLDVPPNMFIARS